LAEIEDGPQEERDAVVDKPVVDVVAGGPVE